MNSFLSKVAISILKTASFGWKPYSRLILYGDDVGWSLDWDMCELANISRKLGVKIVQPYWKHAATPQSIFYASQFFLTNDNWLSLLPNKIGFSYFHGMPQTGDDDFDRIYSGLQRYHHNISRIQVSHMEMQDVVLQTGIDPLKVFLIPIGINLNYFPYCDSEMKAAARLRLGIPQSAFVVGSFQKDGVGWEDGMDPKFIKGPDVFLETIKRLKKSIPELFVLLSGPARGYIKKGLVSADIPYLHVYVRSYPDIAKLYQALDLYVVSSRQEGGPKAVLESMATGVPLVTTQVGQAKDLVKNEKNAFMADVGDVEALTAYALQVHASSQSDLQFMLLAGRKTAEANSYESQIPLWAEFMKGFVE